MPRVVQRPRLQRCTRHVRQGWPWSRCGRRGGTGSMMELLAASRIGVLVSRSMMENTAAR